MPPFTTTVTLEADPDAIARARAALSSVPGAIGKAVPAAVNKTLGRAKTMVVRQLFDVLAVKSQENIRYTGGDRARGKERISVVPYGQESDDGGTLRIMTRPIGLLNFKTRQGPRGVERQVYRDGGFEVIERSFIGVGLNNNKHVFLRQLAKHRVKDAHYKPNIGKIRNSLQNAARNPFYSVSLLRVYRDRPELGQKTRAFMVADFPKQMSSQTDRFLGRSKVEEGVSS